MLSCALRIFLLSLAFAFSVAASQPPRELALTSRPDRLRQTSRLICTRSRPLNPWILTRTCSKTILGFYAMLVGLHMHILDILVVNDHDPYRRNLSPQREDAEKVIQASHGDATLCTTFDPFQFSHAEFSASVIRGLNQDFANGAIAMKIWKNIGMELKDKEWSVRSGRQSCLRAPSTATFKATTALLWRIKLPNRTKPGRPRILTAVDYSYYKENPIWYMYNKPDAPKKKQILDARDHVLALNPKLRVVGAHLGEPGR